MLHLPFNTHRLTLLLECGCPDMATLYDRCLLRYVRRVVQLPAGHPSLVAYHAQVARHAVDVAVPRRRLLPTLAAADAAVRERLPDEAKLSAEFSPMELHHAMILHQAAQAEAAGHVQDYYRNICPRRDRARPYPYPATYLLQDPHIAASARARLRLNRNNLRASLFRRGMAASALCPWCPNRPQTLGHIVFECAAGPWSAVQADSCSVQQLLGAGDPEDHSTPATFTVMLAASAAVLLQLTAAERL